MIKLKNLLKESFTTKYWGSRKFGDKLPTLGDYKKLKEDNLNEGVNKRLGWMDELIDQLGSEKKVLEEVFRALSDKEAKEIHAWIMRHWS